MMNRKWSRSTFLSQNVYHVIVTLSDTTFSSHTTCITDDLLINWREIDTLLGNISENKRIIDNSSDWFLDKLSQVWSIISLAHDKFIKSSLEKRLHLLSFCSLQNQIIDLERAIREYDSLSNNDILLLLLKLTAGLERSLGDIYSTCGSIVPFLLKDLLASQYLEQKLGKTQIRLLQLLIGCVQGLNLRNVAWHGFFCPGEIHKKVISIFVICIASLGKEINASDIQKRLLIGRDYFDAHSKLLCNFYPDIEFDKRFFIAAIKYCSYISQKQWSSWEYTFDLFISKRFGDSLVFLMPLLESMLRSVFCSINVCPERTLTAESSAYYITLDDILAQCASDKKENKLPLIIGTKLFQMLLDLFVYQEGPRLRDKVSHFEVDVEDIPQSIAQYTFGMTISLIMQLSLENNVADSGIMEGFSMFSSVPEQYVPLYHPSSQLVRSMVITVGCVADWQSLPAPPEFKSNPDNTASELLRQWSGHKSNNIDDLFSQIKSTLKLISPLTLFRPKPELELITCLRKCISNIDVINENIVGISALRFDQWNSREMKSRTRDNYQRMVDCLPVFQCGLAFLFISILTTLKELSRNEVPCMKSILRSYKNYLQFVENASSMSSVKKNRWKEINEATLVMITSVKANK